jgi:hypothetical protein
MSSPKRTEQERWARTAKAHVKASKAELLALGAKFARYEVPGIGPTTTETGRAISPGKVTRKSWSVRKTPRGVVEKPLSAGMAVHPKPLTRTPLHPECGTRLHQYGACVTFARMSGGTTWFFRLGLCLEAQGRYALHLGDAVLGYMDNAQQALGWAMAAKKLGVPVAMVDTE